MENYMAEDVNYR